MCGWFCRCLAWLVWACCSMCDPAGLDVGSGLCPQAVSVCGSGAGTNCIHHFRAIHGQLVWHGHMVTRMYVPWGRRCPAACWSVRGVTR